ncbi:hypothetical protein NL676_023910 [Syzygium grande]|nr:hypothetical protein NL676_023910 [Syzygium grande]
MVKPQIANTTSDGKVGFAKSGPKLVGGREGKLARIGEANLTIAWVAMAGLALASKGDRFLLARARPGRGPMTLAAPAADPSRWWWGGSNGNEAPRSYYNV